MRHAGRYSRLQDGHSSSVACEHTCNLIVGGLQEVQVEEDALSQQHKSPEQRPWLLQLQECQQVLHSTPQHLTSSTCLLPPYRKLTPVLKISGKTIVALKAGSRSEAQ